MKISGDIQYIYVENMEEIILQSKFLMTVNEIFWKA